MKINISDKVIQMALESHFIQQWSVKSTEWRSREVERRQHHISEIVCGVIINQYRKQKLLPYNKK